MKDSVQLEHKIQTYENELKEIKNSLKVPVDYMLYIIVIFLYQIKCFQNFQLSQADTAILVSSKQQLQLDNLDLNELVKSLKQELDKQKQQLTEKDVKIASLKRNNSIVEVMNSILN